MTPFRRPHLKKFGVLSALVAVAGLLLIDRLVWLFADPQARCEKALHTHFIIERKCFDESADSQLLYYPRANSSCFPYGLFPDKPHPVEKDADTIRILALGDSVTYNPIHMHTRGGVGYVERLEGLLNANGGESWEVINGAVGSYNTAQEHQYYKSYLKQYKPDIVTLEYLEYHNYEPPVTPIFYTTVRECVENSVPNFLRLGGNAHRLLARHSGLYAFFSQRLYNLLGRFDGVGYPPLFFKNVDSMSWLEINRNALLQLSDDLNADSIPFFLIVFPILDDSLRRDPWLQTVVAQKIGPENLLFLDDRLKEFGSLAQFRSSPGDSLHPGFRGHKIAAEALYEKISTSKSVRNLRQRRSLEKR
jgi:lysophospholipase L1-like esterase